MLSRATMIARETGLIDAIYHKYLPSTDSAGRINSHDPIPLSVSMITGTLIIIGTGLTCSLLIFAAEHFDTACQLRKLGNTTQKREMPPSIRFHHQDLAIEENLTVPQQCKSKLKEVLQIVDAASSTPGRLNRLNQFLDSWLFDHTVISDSNAWCLSVYFGVKVLCWLCWVSHAV